MVGSYGLMDNRLKEFEDIKTIKKIKRNVDQNIELITNAITKLASQEFKSVVLNQGSKKIILMDFNEVLSKLIQVKKKVDATQDGLKRQTSMILSETEELIFNNILKDRKSKDFLVTELLYKMKQIVGGDKQLAKFLLDHPDLVTFFDGRCVDSESIRQCTGRYRKSKKNSMYEPPKK